MCHHIETADHERVAELAAEFEEWKREKEAERADEDDGGATGEPEEPAVAPADD
ncbi:MAG: hypothetical protein ABEH40_08095 [Haloferacaceae archaeon]